MAIEIDLERATVVDALARLTGSMEYTACSDTALAALVQHADMRELLDVQHKDAERIAVALESIVLSLKKILNDGIPVERV